MKPKIRTKRGVIFLLSLLCAQNTLAAVAHPWYLRAGLGYSRSQSAQFNDFNCHATNPPALFGCNDNAQGNFASSALLEAGVGYRFTDIVRGEIIVNNQPGFHYSGNANFAKAGAVQPVSANVNSYAILAAGFVDIAPLSTPTLRPYVGAGLGVARQHLNSVLFEFPALNPAPGEYAITQTPGGNHTGLAYMLSAGVAWQLTANMVMEFAYRYSDLGQVKTDAGPANVDWHPHGAPPHLLTVNSIQAPLRMQSLLLSLRYSF